MRTNNPKNHYYGLDLLRAISLAGVFLFHLNEKKIPYGYLGVIGFLALAGFLSVMKVRDRREAPDYLLSFGQTITKRIAKLYPPLIWMLLPLSVCMILLFPAFLDHYSYQMRTALMSVNNIWQIMNGDSYFQGAGYLKPLTHLWALSLEFQYYIFMGLSFEGLYRKKHRWVWFFIFTFLAVLSYSEFYLLFDPLRDPTRVYYGPDTRFYSFALGAMAGLLYPDQPIRDQTRNYLDTLGWILCIPAVCAFAAPISETWMIRVGMGAYSVLFAVILLLFSAGGKLSIYAGQSIPVQWLVSRSYWIYLWHFPVFRISERLLSFYDLPAYVHSMVQIAASLILSEIAFRWEKGLKAERAKRTASQAHGKRAKLSNKSGREWKRLLASGIALALFVLPWMKIYEWSGGSEFGRLEARISEQEAQLAARKSEKQAEGQGITFQREEMGGGSASADFPGKERPVSDDQNMVPSPVSPIAESGENALNPPKPGKTKPSSPLPTTKEGKKLSGKLMLPEKKELSAEEEYILSAVLADIEAYNVYNDDYYIDPADYQKYRNIPVTMIGDSVSVIASYHIDPYLPGIYLDALSNRQTVDLPAVYEEIKKDGMLGEILVIALGTNGDIDRAALETVLKDWGEKPVLLFSIVLPYAAQETERNTALRNFARSHAQVWMVEWHDNTKGVELFYQEDLIHPSDPYGCKAFCQLLTAKLLKVIKLYDEAGLLSQAVPAVKP